SELAKHPTHSLDAIGDSFGRLLRVGKPQGVCSASVDKERLARHVGDSSLNRFGKHSSRVGIPVKLHQNEKPAEWFGPARTGSSEQIEPLKHRAATDLIEFPKLR